MAFMYVCVCMCVNLLYCKMKYCNRKKVKKAYNAKFNLTLSDMPI